MKTTLMKATPLSELFSQKLYNLFLSFLLESKAHILKSYKYWRTIENLN